MFVCLFACLLACFLACLLVCFLASIRCPGALEFWDHIIPDQGWRFSRPLKPVLSDCKGWFGLGSSLPLGHNLLGPQPQKGSGLPASFHLWWALCSNLPPMPPNVWKHYCPHPLFQMGKCLQGRSGPKCWAHPSDFLSSLGRQPCNSLVSC